MEFVIKTMYAQNKKTEQLYNNCSETTNKNNDTQKRTK